MFYSLVDHGRICGDYPLGSLEFASNATFLFNEPHVKKKLNELKSGVKPFVHQNLTRALTWEKSNLSKVFFFLCKFLVGQKNGPSV